MSLCRVMSAYPYPILYAYLCYPLSIVLMSIDGHAVLTDFGLAKDFTTSKAATVAATVGTTTATATVGTDEQGNFTTTTMMMEDGAKSSDQTTSGGTGFSSDRSATLNSDGERTKTLCGTTEYMAPG
jgi:serine/threonine protein kinase